MNRALRSLLAGAAVLGTSLAVGACSTSTAPSSSTSSRSTPSSAPAATTATAGSGEVMFALMMIPHHEQAVQMADIAAAKASASSQVRQLAASIKAAQEPEIQQMTGWLRVWSAPTAAAGMGDERGMGSGMMADADLAALRSAEGDDFNRRWASMMIAHHQGAVSMAEQVLATTTDPQVKELAEAIVTSQTAEIAQMQSLAQGT